MGRSAYNKETIKELHKMDMEAAEHGFDDVPTAKVKSPFDLKAFKKYVSTYKESDGCGSADTFIKDMLYGIGLAIDDKKYYANPGYKKFLAYLKKFIPSVKPVRMGENFPVKHTKS